MKTISKGLILALVIQFALFLPFLSVVEAEKSKADDPSAVPATDPILNLRSSSTSSNTLRIVASYGTGTESREFVFDSPVVLKASEDFLNASHIPRYSRRADDMDDVKAYRLNRPTLSCRTGTQLRLIYLITVKYRDDEGNKARFSGIYVAYNPSSGSSAEHSKYQLLKDNAFTGPGWCHNLQEDNPNDANIIRLANSSYINSPFVPRISTDEKEQMCNDIESNWEQLKDDARDMFNPAPGSTGQSQNENWIITGGMWNAAAWWAASRESADAFADWFERVVGITPDGRETLIAIRQQKLAPSATGIHRFVSIMERARKLQEDTDAILASDDPTCDDIELKIFKWNKSLEGEVYPDLASFRADIDRLIDTANLFYNSYQEPVVTAGTDDICGNALNDPSKIFPWMFCKLGEIVHMIAVSIINKSIGWLEASIGIDEIRFEKSNLDTDSLVDHQNTTTQDQIREAAVALCNEKKPPATAQADWDRGPCLTSNMNNTGYAVDIAHSPRTEVDNQNVCPSPTKWIELNTSCSIIGQRH